MNLQSKIAFGCLALVVLGCGGAAGGSSTLPQFATPVAINMPDNITFISGVSPSGKMVGRSDPTGTSPTATPYYWSSPTATPTVLPASASLASWPTGINDRGQIIGSGGTGISIYWTNPASPPTQLPAPAGLPDVGVQAINSSGQMVGIAMSGGFNGTAVQWDDSTSVHTLSTSATWSCANFIADDGSIYGTINISLTGDQPAFWASGGADGVILPSGGSNMHGTVFAMNRHTGDAVSAGLNSNGALAATGPLMWLRLTQNYVNLPSSFTPTGVADDGMISYSTFPGAVSSQALIAPGPQTAPALMNSFIPPGTGWDLKDAVFVLGDGSVIGRGSLTVGGVTTDKWFYAKRKH